MGSLKRIVKSIENSLSKIGRATKERPLSLASIFILVGVATWGMNYMQTPQIRNEKEQETKQETILIAESFERSAIVQVEMPAATISVTTYVGTTTSASITTTTSVATTASEVTTTSIGTTTQTELVVKPAETKVSEDEVEDESVYDTDCTAVGQYGYSINSDEYIYLAQVIEHEGGGCSTEIKERIGICMLNRTFASGFCDSVYANKEAPGQYFSGWYDYSEESSAIAMSLISAYNSGADYWAQFCADRYLTTDTIYQRNDYAVPGTQEVYRETATTSGGYTFTLVYSR